MYLDGFGDLTEKLHAPSGGYSGGDRGGYGRGGMPGARQRNGGPVPYDDPMAPKIESTRSEADRVDRVENTSESFERTFQFPRV